MLKRSRKQCRHSWSLVDQGWAGLQAHEHISGSNSFDATTLEQHSAWCVDPIEYRSDLGQRSFNDLAIQTWAKIITQLGLLITRLGPF